MKYSTAKNLGNLPKIQAKKKFASKKNFCPKNWQFAKNLGRKNKNLEKKIFVKKFGKFPKKLAFYFYSMLNK